MGKRDQTAEAALRHQRERDRVEEVCKFLNHRARYKYSLEILLKAAGVPDEQVEEAITQAALANFKPMEAICKRLSETLAQP